MGHEHRDVMESVRRALGRTGPVSSVPPPPSIPEPIARLVHSDIGLPQLFAKNAAELKMLVSFAAPDEVAEQVIAFLREKNIKRIVLPASKLLDQLDILPQLQKAGFDARLWKETTLDESYEFDCGLTDATYAVAETGSVVIRFTPDHPRCISLVPMYHVVILDPKIFLPDTLDLMEKLVKDGCANGVCMISGPSKTADIEMNVVTGVHGPNVVKAFILQ
jgi:L-lactate dehydrogenase complex protein LldG